MALLRNGFGKTAFQLKQGAKLTLSDILGGGALAFNNVFYVDSGAGSNQNNGQSPDQAFASIDHAVGQTVATSGDVIIALPGHAETISAAGSLTLDVAGVKVIGVGEGRDRPTLTWTATTGTVEIDAVNVTLENLVFLASISAVAVGINVDANDATIRGCEFNFDETGDDFVIGVDPASVARFTFEGNRFIAEEAAGTADGIRINDSDFYRISGNFFDGTYSNAPIRSVTGVSTGVLIESNFVRNASTTAADGCILLATADTGVIANNFMATENTTATDADSAIFDPGSAQCANNTLARGDDKAGYSVPVSSLTGGGAISWRLAKHASTAFDGGTVNAHGDFDGTGMPYTIFTVTGDVVIRSIWGVVNTTLTGVAATVSVGVTGNTAGLIALETATDLADGNIYTSATNAVGAAATGFSGADVAINDGLEIIETLGTANVTAGQIDYYAIWAPAEDGAYLA